MWRRSSSLYAGRQNLADRIGYLRRVHDRAIDHCVLCQMLGSKLTNSYPPLVCFNSTALIELDPMSSPTNCLLFPPNNDMTRPLSPTLTKSNGALNLAHLALHPTIQDGLPKFQRLPSLNAGISPSVM